MLAVRVQVPPCFARSAQQGKEAHLWLVRNVIRLRDQQLLPLRQLQLGQGSYISGILGGDLAAQPLVP